VRVIGESNSPLPPPTLTPSYTLPPNYSTTHPSLSLSLIQILPTTSTTATNNVMSIAKQTAANNSTANAITTIAIEDDDMATIARDGGDSKLTSTTVFEGSSHLLATRSSLS
jgi:hypothetical protein